MGLRAEWLRMWRSLTKSSYHKASHVFVCVFLGKVVKTAKALEIRMCHVAGILLSFRLGHQGLPLPCGAQIQVGEKVPAVGSLAMRGYIRL